MTIFDAVDELVCLLVILNALLGTLVVYLGSPGSNSCPGSIPGIIL